ncbi:MAG: hypothetical protein GY943_15010, partial [Chloroflexi bacterium]|nr:hypothetical protein [Chloroflexota bacterium]
TNITKLTDNSYNWSAEFSPDGRHIAYLHADDGGHSLYLMNADGTNQREIYNSGPYEWGHHWSPNLSHIYLTLDVNESGNVIGYIYRINTAGQGVTLLTRRGSYPSFAPSSPAIDDVPIVYQLVGERIAYQCGGETDSSIYLYDPETGSESLLPNQLENSHVPTFSPDGTMIGYRSDFYGDWGMFVSALDGHFQRMITPMNLETDYKEGVWSPDNTQMALMSDQDGSEQLFVVGSDGTGVERFTFNEDRADDPAWSSLGEIAYEGVINSRTSIYIKPELNARTAVEIALGDSTATPAWSPDGTQLAFEVRAGDEWQIWIADRDGANPRQITTEGDINQRPAWSPDGQQLVFYSNLDNPSGFDIWTLDLESDNLERITNGGDCINPAWGEVALPEG